MFCVFITILLFITMAVYGVKLRTILQGLQNEKMIPILNESGLLKIPGFKMNLVH